MFKISFLPHCSIFWSCFVVKKNLIFECQYFASVRLKKKSVLDFRYGLVFQKTLCQMTSVKENYRRHEYWKFKTSCELGSNMLQ